MFCITNIYYDLNNIGDYENLFNTKIKNSYDLIILLNKYFTKIENMNNTDEISFTPKL